MRTTQWGIIGPGTIARNFADGLKEASSGHLRAIASRDEARRRSFGDAYEIEPAKRYADYASLLADDDVDAVYIATPHPFHAELAVKALRAGKHVLTEKPAGLTAGQVVAVTEVAKQTENFFMEAVMYRCHPQIERMADIIRDGQIGEVRHVSASFGFAAPFDPASRLYDRALAGGAVLDVGCYPISFARLVAGLATGSRYENPISVKAVGHMAASAVDDEAHALLTFSSGMIATCSVSTRRPMANEALVVGSEGSLRLKNPWVPGRNAGPSDATIEITSGGQTELEEIRSPKHLFAFEAEVASRAILDGLTEPPPLAMDWADSIGNAETLDRWRDEIGYHFTLEDRASASVLTGVLPVPRKKVPKRRIDGLDRPVSALVMGCDNKNHAVDGAIVWDAWMEAGGNAFDTAFVYAAGLHETVLGQWIRARGVANDVVVIAKGGHTPYCTPRALEAQLNQSLDRLGLSSVPIYIMHRDNPDVPVGEFVDALNRLREAGRIGIFGGSNWTVRRFREANAYAETNGLEPFRILNNNLSLAVMERPIWPGCVTSNTRETLSFLRSTNTIHLSWSSQARGYFLPADLRNRLPAEIGPDLCFGSEANAERRRRAETLASERGVSTHNIATAWVLAQSFPSFALIGPRSPGEIASTLPALGVELSREEAAWLNLEADSR
ncbi:MAG: aldo/keto reductase [Geminicoccaceae bacterium]